ncbi:NRPS, partial [Diaporthe eres]
HVSSADLDVQLVLKRTLSHKGGLLQPEYKTVTPLDVVSGTQIQTNNTVVDWEAEPQLPVQLNSVDSATRFEGNKTYVLFGLTSDLGLSLCDWMVSHGARNIVLTSRRPQVDERWLSQKKKAGVRIEVISNDITSKAAVEGLVGTIRREWPPIAGIMHGAMVLQDAVFSEMSHETMTKVLRPKVLGAIYLDQLFQSDHPLDFFIFFSSLASASGNRGQSNYSAANMFMTAKTFERRRKGLAASVLHIGAVMGVGYVMREVSETVFPAIRRAGFMWMEERGFHQCIAESILAGRPGSGRNPEIVTGLRLVNAKEEEPTPWMNNPRFQHCVNWGDVVGSKDTRHAGTTAMAPKRALQQASTPEEVARIVEDSIIAKFQVALQLPAMEDERARATLLQSNADDLGVDSLVAVEIRSWFLKELDVKMPVLKILGGATVQDMVTFAFEKVSADNTITPCLDGTALSTSFSSPKELEVDVISGAQTTTPDPEYSSEGNTGSSSAQSSASSVWEPANGLPKSLLTPSSPETPMSDVGDIPLTITPTTAKTEPKKAQKPEFVKRVPLSFGQSRFWFLRRYVEDPTTFNITFSVKLKGPLRTTALAAAVEKLGARHEALRTAFIEDQGRIMQAVLGTSRLSLEKKSVVDIEEVDNIFQSVKSYVYNIEEGDSMRILLLSSPDPEVHHLIIGYHHINMDGASLEVFLADLERAYMGRPFIPKSPLQYPDYAEKQRRDVESGSLKDSIAYWHQELLSPIPAPVLPLLPSSTSKSRQPLHNYDHVRVDRRIDPRLAKKVQQACSQQKANAFHFYMAVFQLTLYRLLGTSDICLGMADGNRFEGNLSTSMGMYLNLLPVRFSLDPEGGSFSGVLKQTRRKVYGALANSALPFDVLLDELKIPRSTTHSPLFQAFINYRSGVAEKRTLGAVEGQGEEYQFGRTGYDISIDIMDDPNGTPLLMFNGQKGLYSLQDTEVFADGFVQILEYFSNSPTASLASAPVLEASGLISESISRGADGESVWSETVVHQIDKWISSQPSAVALNNTNGNTWTYREMGFRVKDLALALTELGVKVGSKVCVFQEPCIDWVCTMVAILRVGAVYVALDTQLPAARLSNLLEQCEPTALVVHDATASLVPALVQGRSEVSILNLSTTATASTNRSAVELPIASTVKGPACILFTSGTTGKPKGVVLSHENLRNHLEWGQVKGSEVILQQSACSFDLALEQVLLALVYGGTLVVVPRELRGDPVGITKVMLTEKVTWTGATPSEYHSWIQYGYDNLRQCQQWRLAFSVGEEMPQVLVKSFDALGLESLHVWNSYGPCETTLGTTATEVQSDDGRVLQLITVGKTLPNRAIYILDNDLKPVPTGVVGEVVIGGAGVAIGYLGNDDQTAASFLPDPFATAYYKSHGWTRMYRTGDRGRLQSDTGDIELVGRIDGDTQVKIHGARVELQEVEAAIQHLAGNIITAVAVTARGGQKSTSPFLVAHVVLAPGATSDAQLDAVKRALSDEWPLPRYMNPAVIIPVASLPRTPSGKLDRGAISALPISNGSQQATAAAQLSNMEDQVRSAWEEVLAPSTPVEDGLHHPRHIDGGSDFFHVGGNSMLLIKLQALIKRRFGASITVMRLFERSTLRDMASEIHDATSALDIEVDWIAETAMGKDVVDAGNFNIASLKEKGKSASSGLVVILTGATGFLGMEVLSQLVTSPRVVTVHVIAVRSASKLGALADSPKVVVHAGDLTQDRLGLSPETAREIFSQSHVLIHSGSDVSFLKTYQTLRVPNVEGTKELARLALEHGVLFHYISTAVTGRLNQQDSFGEVSLRDSTPPPDWQDGYIASKWAAEVFLENVHDELGLPVWIHRPSSITGDGASETDVMNSVVKFARLLRAVPISNRWRGLLDFISLEKSARGILETALADPETRSDISGDVKYLHHSGELLIPVDGLHRYLEKWDQQDYREIALGEWVEEAVQKGLNVLIAAYLSAIDEFKLDIVFQRLT